MTFSVPQFPKVRQLQEMKPSVDDLQCQQIIVKDVVTRFIKAQSRLKSRIQVTSSTWDRN